MSEPKSTERRDNIHTRGHKPGNGYRPNTAKGPTTPAPKPSAGPGGGSTTSK